MEKGPLQAQQSPQGWGEHSVKLIWEADLLFLAKLLS